MADPILYMMIPRIAFYTKNLKTDFYRRAISLSITENLANKYEDLRGQLRNWVVNIYPVEMYDQVLPSMSQYMTSSDKGTLNLNMPHGVTGDGTVYIFVNDLDDLGLIAVENMWVIDHELAHMYTKLLFPDLRVALEHDDMSGNKAGTVLDAMTALVHDAVSEDLNFTQEVDYYNFGIMSWLPVMLKFLKMSPMFQRYDPSYQPLI